MAAALAASIMNLVLGLELGPTGQDTSNRFSLEGLTWASRPEGVIEIGIERLEAASLRLASGPFMLEVGRLALHGLAAQVRMEGGRPRLRALQAANAELSGVKGHGPLMVPRPVKGGSHAPHAPEGATASGDTTAGQAVAGSWCLGPLAAANGTIRAEIVDAHLLFDADVTVPIRQGLVDFNEATVEHVGPDSRMGVSRLGVYVDAPNGRSYLFQFSSPRVTGVEYEQRGALLGPRVTDRGKLRLQAFGESLLGQVRSGHGLGLTEQARLLFDRTALSGDVRLSDGKFAAPGVQAEVLGRAEGRNTVRVHSEAVGRGLTAEMDSLAVRQAGLSLKGTQLDCDEVTGALTLRLFVEVAQLCFAFDVASMKLSGLRLDLSRPQSA